MAFTVSCQKGSYQPVGYTTQLECTDEVRYDRFYHFQVNV